MADQVSPKDLVEVRFLPSLHLMNSIVGSRYPNPGDRVKVIQKKDYGSGVLTEGVVQDVLTRSPFHPRGHKVRLTSGTIGRVQEFIDIDKLP